MRRRLGVPWAVLAVLPGCVWLSDAEVATWLEGATCEGDARGPDAPGCVPFYVDADGDGFGGERTQCLCAATDVFEVRVGGDCDDTRADVNPAAVEVCDDAFTDDDCDPQTENGETLYYLDVDGDGFGTELGRASCEPGPQFRALVPGDCDDADPAVSSDADEVCDGIDNDCDPTTEEAGLVTVRGGSTYEGDLQAALDSAASGDVVRVCPGTYSGAVVAVPLTLEGLGDAGATVLDAAGAGSALVVAGVAVTLRDLTLTGGTGTEVATGRFAGGGLLALAGAAVSGEGIVVTGNAVNGDGGGIYTTGPLDLHDSLIFDNAATLDGGGVYTTGTTLGLRDANLFYNQADRGAGIFVAGADVLLDNTRIAGNFGNNGGGAYVAGTSTVTGGSITSNSATVLGAGVLLHAPGGSLVLEDVAVTDNIALGHGGGAAILEGTLVSLGAHWVDTTPEACARANYPDDVYVEGVAVCAPDAADFECDAESCDGDVSADCDCPL